MSSPIAIKGMAETILSCSKRGRKCDAGGLEHPAHASKEADFVIGVLTPPNQNCCKGRVPETISFN